MQEADFAADKTALRPDPEDVGMPLAGPASPQLPPVPLLELIEGGPIQPNAHGAV